MRYHVLTACAGLALGVHSAALAQQYLMVPHTTNGIMLFSPTDGSVLVNSFIPKAGPAWDSTISVLKQAYQVGDEIWITVQANNIIWRFDLNGKYYGKITGYIGNNRGMHLYNGQVFVTNTSAQGGSSVGIVKLDPTTGGFLSTFAAGTGTSGNWDVTVANDVVYIADNTAIRTYDLAGASLGTFGPAIAGSRQLTRKANGNFLVANANTAGTLGIYELDPTGVQVNYRNTGGNAVTGCAELTNGNYLYTGSNVWIYDTINSISAQVLAGTGQFIEPLTINNAASGACCFLDGTCGIRSIADCGTQNGVFRGDGTVCASALCPASGACCAPDGACSLLPVDFCTTADGIWRGAGTTCATANCPHRLITADTSLSSPTAGNGIFMDLTPNTAINVTQIDYHPTVAAGAAVTVDLYTKTGTYIGFDADPGPWTHVGTFNTTSGGNAAASPGTALILSSPIPIAANQTLGVYVVGTVGGYRYRGSTSTNPTSDAILSLESNIGRSTLFGGTQSTSRRFGGVVYYTLAAACYPNCDNSTVAPILNVQDFSCFLNSFANGETYANCDNSTVPPTLNVQDFSCFLNQFANGCP